MVSDGEVDTFYTSAGILMNIALDDRWQLTPSFGAGYYNNGHGLNLGLDMEFRSALEMSFELSNGQRVGLAVVHLSNSSLSDANPGTETVQLNWMIPWFR